MKIEIGEMKWRKKIEEKMVLGNDRQAFRQNVWNKNLDLLLKFRQCDVNLKLRFRNFKEKF